MNETHAGYRLDYLELLNWGTFDGRTSRIVPSGLSSLMTGANGSGKTTLVDALLTIMVPTQKRFYNQSSGAEQKKDRSEESYMLGEVGKNREDEELEAKKKYLRPDKSTVVSVLLACFHNPETRAYVTLVQVRWFSSTELKRIYVVSPHKLSIDLDVLPFDKHGDWRKRLKNTFAKTEITDSFSQYSQEFIRLFNMRSDKALTLFNQTVGIKVLGNLNEFIRHHMLEDGKQEDEFQQLRANYLDLLETYKNLQKAEEQIRLLTPIIECGRQHTAVLTALAQLENVKNALPFYFAEHEIEVLNTLVSDIRGLLHEQQELIVRKEGEKAGKEKEYMALQMAIDHNEASKAIRELELQIQTLTIDLQRKKDKAKEYDAISDRLQYKKVDSLETFNSNGKRAEQDLLKLEKSLEENRKHEIEFSIELRKKDDEQKIVESELASLRGRQNRIPQANIELRQRMLEVLGLNAEDIPFAGELIRVKGEEKAWEPAIERLVHNVGLRLLVPEKHLRDVNTYVHQTHLRGKIVYDKVYTHAKPRQIHQLDEGITLRDKVEFKPGIGIFEHWLEQEFAEHLNHVCAESEEEFSSLKKALLISGLSKNADRHEKDDRPHRLTPDKFILGWDNKEQIRLLENKLEESRSAAKQVEEKINGLERESKSLLKQKETLQKLQHYTSYNELNWQEDEFVVTQLNQKKEKLSKESGLEELLKQRNEAEQAIKLLKKVIEDEIEKKGKLKERIEKHKESIAELSTLLHTGAFQAAQEFYELLKPYEVEVSLSDPLKKIQAERKKTQEAVEQERDKKGKEESRISKEIIRQMGAFISPAETIRQQFADWSNDTVNLSAKLEYMGDFIKLHERITGEDLPRHKNKFREYMEESVTSRITSFKAGLDNRQEEIEEHIAELNKSLQKIDFNINPHTYIQLRSKTARDLEIRTFIKELKNCIVATADMALAQNDDWMETAFLRIRDLIEKLHNDQPKRKRLIDVRNWLDFEAEEFAREDGKRRKTLDSSDSLSGGEKAQFTYTILGAAIAFQFGINDYKSNSFRFIAVDEAFSKLDPDKSRYLMDLCRQLNLQILVVTPLDKIYVAEEYIASCHFVEKQSTDRSKVYNLTMSQYYEQKEKWTKSQYN